MALFGITDDLRAAFLNSDGTEGTEIFPDSIQELSKTLYRLETFIVRNQLKLPSTIVAVVKFILNLINGGK